MVGSLTGAVSSQSVTEEHKGGLSTVGHRAVSVMAQARLTARQTRRAGTKVGHSDPVVPYGRAIAQRMTGRPLYTSDGADERTSVESGSGQYMQKNTQQSPQQQIPETR